MEIIFKKIIFIEIYIYSNAVSRYINSENFYNFLPTDIALEFILLLLKAIKTHVTMETIKVDNISSLFIASDTFVRVYFDLRNFISWNSHKRWAVFKLVVDILFSINFFHVIHFLLFVIFSNFFCPARKNHCRI